MRKSKILIYVALFASIHFSLSGQNIDSLMNEGLKLQQQFKYQEAIVLYQKVLDIRPNDANGMYQKALCYMRNNEPQEALTIFLKLTTTRSDFVGGFYGAATAYSSLEKYTKAIEYIEKAMEFEPKNSEYYMVRGQIYANMGDKKSACKDFKMAKKLGNPDAKFSMQKYCR
ncbi:MAG TPA: CDC27 family protein [Salinivirgaceae bacterium]|nr:CDC27 family protein [Salinivirgaceae bacterium]HQA76505.1 CDC27 family protein [Salinivirgaceae bacterium]